jgi:hypothetical protein
MNNPFFPVGVFVLLGMSGLLGPAPVAVAQDVVKAVASDGAISLAGQWRCQAVSQVDEALLSEKADDSGWASVEAPGRWDVQKANPQGLPAVIYRRTVDAPADWKGRQVGISAWFCGTDSLVYVNGQEVDPAGPPNALYADVSGILRYGEENLIAVSTTGDGIRELAEVGPPLLGPIGQKTLTKVNRTAVNIPVQPKPLPANLFVPEGKTGLGLVIFASTGHADYSIKDDWRQLNDDLARRGYASLAVQFSRFTPEEFAAVLSYASSLGVVDHSRIVLVGTMKASRPAALAAVASPGVRGLVLVSSAKVPEIAQMGDRPVLFVCGDLESSVPALAAARQMSAGLTGPHAIAALTSTASGVALLDTSWNGLRDAFLGWLDLQVKAAQ